MTLGLLRDLRCRWTAFVYVILKIYLLTKHLLVIYKYGGCMYTLNKGYKIKHKIHSEINWKVNMITFVDLRAFSRQNILEKQRR